MFKFKEPVRTHVRHLTELLEYANSRNDGSWALGYTCVDHRDNGVYGNVQHTIDAIIREELGREVYDAFEHCDINYGGNGSWLEDFEAAVDEAIEEVSESYTPVYGRCSWCDEVCSPDDDHEACTLLNTDYGPDGR